MRVYDYYKETNKKISYKKIILGIIIVVALLLVVLASTFYTEIVQLNEIGNYSSIFIRNVIYQSVFFIVSFIIIFALLFVTNLIIKRTTTKYLQNREQNLKLPYNIMSIIIALFGSLFVKNVFYLKALEFFNSEKFNINDPIFNNDIGYYIFERPFLISIYQFFSILLIFIIVYSLVIYYIRIMPSNGIVTLNDPKLKAIKIHNLINVAIFFMVKIFSYKLQRESVLFSDVVGVDGANYVDVNIWLQYYTIAPFLLLVIVILSLVFIIRKKLKLATITILIFPIVYIIVLTTATIVQSFIVNPNDYEYELPYLKNNIEGTRKAYNIDEYEGHNFESLEELSYDILKRNEDIKNNIRIVDYQATLESNQHLQGLTPFYSFYDGDIINYEVNGVDTPVLISAREISTAKMNEKTYVNEMFRYTHGYGVVINPINKITKQGQVDFILSDLNGKTIDDSLKITEPRIYYGELTDNQVVVNPEGSGKMTEIDKDGNSEVSYKGDSGIKLGFLNRLLFSIKTGDFKLLISGNINSESKLLINRSIVKRAQKPIPFVKIDDDPYIVLTKDGRLKWILDGYTYTDNYPYSESSGDFNYIRNSIKVVIDAYNGNVDYYVMDKNDPIIKTYMNIYPDVFKDEELPDYVKEHMRYPELLFKVQTDMLKQYHLDPEKDEQVRAFRGKQEFWDIAKLNEKDSNDSLIEPFYNMIQLPDKYNKGNELILMRPFTPIGGRHNLVSWLAVRNSYEDYGKLILFQFPKNNNVLGPYQIGVKINQIDYISKNMTLWGQSGSEVFKGNLLVIPIENSLLYIEPIYIKSGENAIPEVRLIVAGYQSGNEFRYGIGSDLDSALEDLYKEVKPLDEENGIDQVENVESEVDIGKDDIEKIKEKYEEIKKQLEDLGKLIEELE